MDRRPLRAEGVLSQVANDTLVLLNAETGQYYTLELVGARIWELCDGTRTANDIVVAISREYEADETIVRGDTAELLSELSAVGLIAPADEPR
jgi:hypothetical protein